MSRAALRYLFMFGIGVLSLGSFFIEARLAAELGIWWGIFGAGVVFQILYILGDRFIKQQTGRRVFGGLAGIMALAFKLSWEVFYISYGLSRLSTAAGLLVGGLLALGWFYFWLKAFKGQV
jgi:hypothetical protein